MDNIFVDLNDTTLSTEDHYLHFSCSPKFVILKEKGLFSETPVYIPEEITEQRKLDALKEVVKLTPIWTLIQQAKAN